MSELQITDGNSSENGREHGLTRRQFLYFAGIGAASLAFASTPVKALAAQTNAGATVSTAASTTANGRVIGWLHWDDGGDTATPFVFDPSFFQDGAMTYNAHLATFGCCVANSAINADPGGGTDAKYQNMYRNVRSLMDQIGIKDGDVEEYSYECDGTTVSGHKAGDIAWNKDFDEAPAYNPKNKPKATIGLCVGHRKIAVGGKECNLVILAVRGGNYEMEWCSNFVVGSSGNHEGFQEAADEATTFLKCHLREYGLTGPTKILICGHSRGGATANMTAGNIVKYAIQHNAEKASDAEGYDLAALFDNKIELKQCDLYCYGYAVPAGVFYNGSSEKDQLRDNYKNIHSIINPCDMIPKFVPGDWSCTRYGVDMLLPSPVNRSRYTSGRERMLRRLYALGLHRKNGHFSYELDNFPNVDYGMLDGIASYAVKLRDMPTVDVFLNEFISHMATDVFHARNKTTSLPGYSDRYQAAMVTILELNTEFGNDPEMNTQGADKRTPLEKFMSSATGKIQGDLQGLFSTISNSEPLTVVISYVDDAMRETQIKEGVTVNDRYGDRVRSALHGLLDFDCYVAIKYSYSQEKGSTLSKFLYQYLQEVIAFGMKASLVLSSHSSELYLAWLQSRDSNYIMYGKDDLPDLPDDPSTKSSSTTSSTAATSATATASVTDDAASKQTDEAEANKASDGEATSANANPDTTGTVAASATTVATATLASSANSEDGDDGDTRATNSAGAGNTQDDTAPLAASNDADNGTAPAANNSSEASTDKNDEDHNASDINASDSGSVSARSVSTENTDAAGNSSLGSSTTTAAAASSATDDSNSDNSEVDSDPATYRKIFFNGGTSVSYVANGASYQIFKDGEAVKASGGSYITIDGAECPFLYCVDGDLQQVVYLPDSPNSIDGGTSYSFAVTTEPDAPMKCTTARYNYVDDFPESLYTYESDAGFYAEPLVNYTFDIALDKISGTAYSETEESGEAFSCDLGVGGVTWDAGSTSKVKETDSGDTVAARRYYIDARSADPEMGIVDGGGTSTRGTNSLIIAVPNDGYQFDYWTLDDKWMVDGKEQQPVSWASYSVDEDGNTVRTDPDNISDGQWVEGQRVEGELRKGYNIYRVAVDGDHRITAHFKAASVTPSDDDADNGGSNGNGAAGTSNEADIGTDVSSAKTMAQTGDATPAAIAAATAAAAAATVIAAKACAPEEG